MIFVSSNCILFHTVKPLSLKYVYLYLLVVVMTSFLFRLVLLVSVKVVCCPLEVVYIDSGTKLTVLVSKILSNLWLHVCQFC